MKNFKKHPFISPKSKNKLKFIDGQFKFRNETYFLINEIPDLTYPKKLDKIDQVARNFYDGRADAYENNMHLTFKTHNVDETKTRQSFIDLLNIDKGNKVLDIACGTGRDSEIIANNLGDNGVIVSLDISSDMLRVCKNKFENKKISNFQCIANASNLPFPDNYFDATYSFGGLGEFANIKESLAEMVRVTKVGGKVVVGDESMPTWLRGTYFDKVLTTTNPQFSEKVPLNQIPVEAREFTLRYVINQVFYLFDFVVGEGEPTANFDFIIPGVRGGTYRSRYEGTLESVSPEVKKSFIEHISKKGANRYDWLNNVISDAINNDK